MRLVKDDWEVAQLQAACDATTRGFTDVAAELKNVLAAGGKHVEAVGAADDVFLFVISGSCHIVIAGITYDLDHGDGMDVERATQLEICSADGVTVLLTSATRR